MRSNLSVLNKTARKKFRAALIMSAFIMGVVPFINFRSVCGQPIAFGGLSLVLSTNLWAFQPEHGVEWFECPIRNSIDR